MNFDLSDEQKLLRESLAGFLQRHTHAAAGNLWRALAADCGVLGIGIAPDCGGTGGGAEEIMLVMEQLGRALVAEPYVETLVLGAGLLRRAGGAAAARWLPAVAQGDAMLTLATTERQALDFATISTSARRAEGGWRLDGRKIVVPWADRADAILLPARTEAGLSLFLAERGTAGLSIAVYPTIDGGTAGDVILDDVRLPAEALLGADGDAAGTLEQAADEAIAAVAAEAVGIMQWMLEQTVAYTRQRQQFGQPLAAFQALQHRMADMFLQVELASAAALLATLSLGEDAAARGAAVSAAKVAIAEAARFVGQNAIQLHGGMGMSDETPITRYFKRLTVIEREYGDAGLHLERHRRLH